LREDEWPDVRELTLGKSTDLQFREAIEWLKQRHRQTKQEYQLLLPAVDTESISLVKSSSVFSFRDVLEEASNRQYARGVRFSVAENNGSGIPVPVLLMYGSMGWQLHIRIHVLREDVRNQTSKYAFGKGALPEVATRLMGMLEPGIGQGVRADVDEFLQMMEALYGWTGDCKLKHSVELQKLSMLSGSTQPCSLATFCLTWLGTVMPKSWQASTGDNNWWKTYEQTNASLRVYLHGDIQQVAQMGWLMVVCWAMHLFPDFSLIAAATAFSLPQFLDYWTEKVVKPLLVDRSENCRKPVPGEYSSREELIRQSGIPTSKEYDILRLCPGWPSITGGFIRDNRQAGQYLFEIYPVLREFDPQTFADLSESSMRRKFLGERPAAARAEDLLPVTQHSFFKLKPAEINRERVNRVIREIPAATVRGVMSEYVRMDVGRAVRLLEHFEQNNEVVKQVFCMTQGFKVLEDLRAFLQDIGKLDRPESWVDPYGISTASRAVARQVNLLEIRAVRIAARKAKAVTMARDAELMLQEIAKDELELERAREAAAGPVPVRLTSAHPLVRALESNSTRTVIQRPSRKISQRQRRRAKARWERSNLPVAHPLGGDVSGVAEAVEEVEVMEEDVVEERTVRRVDERMPTPPAAAEDDDCLIVEYSDISEAE
jgi:hypothetical protein